MRLELQFHCPEFGPLIGAEELQAILAVSEGVRLEA